MSDELELENRLLQADLNDAKLALDALGCMAIDIDLWAELVRQREKALAKVAELESENAAANELIDCFVGEETLHQDGKYETEMGRLSAKCAELEAEVAELRATWEALEALRADGWCVVVKALPNNLPFVIQGSRSEYDSPCPDRHVGHDKWCCDAQWMGDSPWQLGAFALKDTPGEAVVEVADIIRTRAAAEKARKP